MGKKGKSFWKKRKAFFKKKGRGFKFSPPPKGAKFFFFFFFLKKKKGRDPVKGINGIEGRGFRQKAKAIL
ncbi:hypothetical protein [Methanosarcina barkeri]|uniref:hypothetical protein n=1 Tax=Methanosarcina barkeri TaxID=2208 RepID=UPI0011874CC6|nr:hypothetical protein [Methanosarcina barkeri]